MDTLKENVDRLRDKLRKSEQFVHYFRADLDTQFDLIMLITEHIVEDNLRQYIEQYGFLDEANSGIYFYNNSD